MGSENFVHLHTHTHMSGFDGIGHADRFAEVVAERGNPAIAFTEHGTIRGIYEADKACDAAGIKFVPGCEFYFSRDAAARGLTKEEKDAILTAHPTVTAGKAAIKAADKVRRERYHITVWALTQEGLRNLFRLNAYAWTEGFYYKPRIDLAALKRFNEGLAVSTGCPTGAVARPLGAGDMREGLDRLEALAEVFGDRLYVEVMPHVVPGRELQAERLVRVADRYGLQLIVTQDAHYPCNDDSEAQDVLLCIHTRDVMSNPDRFHFHGAGYHLRTRLEMTKAFADVGIRLPLELLTEGMDATCRLAERVSCKLETGKMGKYLVAPGLPPGVEDHDEWLYSLAKAAFEKRTGTSLEAASGDYRARLVHELRTIMRLGFASYFLAVWEMVNWAQAQGILVGPGRGSAAGSLVSYLLGITNVDPVRYGLSFERFLAPGRMDLPDIDLDFESARRDEVIDHLRSEYGDAHVAHISTHNTIGGRRALRDLARDYSITSHEVAPVIGLIPEVAEDGTPDDHSALLTVLESSRPGRKFARDNPEVLAVASRIEGQLRDVGMHAAGIVVSSQPLADVVPLESRPRKGGPRVPTVAFDWRGAEDVGLVKFDVLGLRTLTTVSKALELAGRVAEDIDPEDPDALAAFSAARFGGVFQFDTASARRICKGFLFKGLSDVAVMTALNRPGPIQSGLVKEYMLRAAGKAAVKSIHPIYDEVFKDTFGVPVYQEQVVALARDLAGYSAGDADKFRKAIAKKTGLAEHEARFTEGCITAGMGPLAADKLWGELVGFAQYCFNKSHAYAYGAVAVWTMWLKVHHPGPFYAAALATAPDDEARIRLAAEARSVGIPVMPPTVNVGGDGFALRTVKGKVEIVGAIKDIKGLGVATARAIAKRGPFSDLQDFYDKTAGAGLRLNVRAFESLCKATALRDLWPSVRALVEDYAAIWAALKAKAPELPIRKGIREYRGEDLARCVSDVWPMFVDVKGHGLLEAVESSLRAKATRPFEVLDGELPVGSSVVLARLAGFKVFTERDGSGNKTARVVLVGPAGAEFTARMRHEVVERCSSSLSKGAIVLALASRHEWGMVTVEGLWRVDQDILPMEDRCFAAVITPAKTKPADPARRVARLGDGETTVLEGVCVNIRKHTDKREREMMTVALLGSKGMVKLYVFSSRLSGKDTKLFRVGRPLRVRVTKLDGGALCLADGRAVVMSKPKPLV